MMAHLELFNNLNSLVASNEAFIKQKAENGNHKYVIFNYRLASYTDFLQPSAIEARGIMFEVDDNQQFIRLASRPFGKFFNYLENPLTMNLDLTKTVAIQAKEDGSLMSSYIQDNQLFLKSKGSLTSDQVIDSMAFLKQPENVELCNNLLEVTKIGYTVNLEWCAPFNRIVLAYDKPQLIALSVRNNDTGENINANFVPLLEKFAVESVNLGNITDVVSFIDNIPNMTDDIEGYIVQLPDIWVKVKTNKYKKLHMLADNVRSPRRLYEAVLNEAIDDIFSLFDDPVIRQLATDCQEYVSKRYNNLVKNVEEFYEANKNLDRKSFAIKGQVELHQYEFGLAMLLYVGRTVDYKEFMMKRYDVFKLPEWNEPTIEEVVL